MDRPTRYQMIVEDLNRLCIDFRINDLDESLEINFKREGWTFFDQTLEAMVRTELYNIGYGTRKKAAFSAAQNAWVTLASQQRYNPIKEYFDGLNGKYIGLTKDKPDAVYSLAQYFDNPDGLLANWLHRWMVGVVSRVYTGSRNPVLVLAGQQNIGKSTFSRWLCPLPEHYHEGGLNPDKKDDRLRLMNTLIWELGELGAVTRRSDIEALKSFITSAMIKERPPYGSRPIHKRAICSFIGTVNPDGAGFLNDPTGSSRFLVCEVNHINFAYENLNKDRIWSEAVHYFHNHRRAWELTPQEQDFQAQINAQFETINPLEDLIEIHFELTGNDEDFLTTQEIKDVCALHYKSTSDDWLYKNIARTLHKLGLHRARKTYRPGHPHPWGYFAIRKRSKDGI